MGSCLLLEDLPTELQALIMRQAPTIESFYCLIRASPCYYRAFLFMKEDILSHLARRIFHPSVMSDALAVVEATKTTSEEGRSNKDIVHSEEEISPAFDDPLSAAEIARLQRAFCRLELFGCLFYNDIENHAILSPQEQSDMFLANFPYWQVEEIACIRDYLIRRLCGPFDQVENYWVESKLKEGLDMADRWQYEFAIDVSFFGRDNKEKQIDTMEYFLLIGLETLRRIFSATGAELYDLVYSYSADGPLYTLNSALKEPPKRTHEHFRLGFDWRNSAVLSRCDRDDPDCPNEGWLWASHYRPTWRYAEDRKKGLGDWGYVFWDCPGLEAWGVLDKDPDELAEYRFDEDARAEQITADERLCRLLYFPLVQ
ncbi:hypothetical protein VTN96DRAFT_2516 [Rasamsonia emersonii]